MLICRYYASMLATIMLPRRFTLLAMLPLTLDTDMLFATARLMLILPLRGCRC